MLNWGVFLIGLMFSSSTAQTTQQQQQQQDQVDSGIQYLTEDDGVVHLNPGQALPEHLVATDCNVEGIWYNALGSEMILNVTETGLVTGEYRTATERKAGSAGTSAGRVTGWTALQESSYKTVSFSVLWNNGTSVTVWAGLCHVCDGLEIIKTTWILTSDVATCNDHWSSNRVGQDHFTRFEQIPGPRRHLNIHTPSEFAAAAADAPREGILSQEQQRL